MKFAIKAAVGEPQARAFDFPAQKTKGGDKHIPSGGTIDAFASENAGGPGPVATGTVTAARAVPRTPGIERQTPRVGITVRRTTRAKRRLGQAHAPHLPSFDPCRMHSAAGAS